MNTDAMQLVSSVCVGAAIFLAAVSLPSIWNSITARYVADFTPALESLNIDRSKIPTYLRWWGICLLAIVVLSLVLGFLPLAVPLAYLVFVAPRIWLKWAIRKRQLKLRDQLVGATVALANTSRAGMSLAQGFESVAKETPSPLSTELKRIVHHHKNGLPMPRAINDTKVRLNLDSFTLFAAAVLTCLERGGRITEALERISYSLSENQRIERKLESETAAGRRVVRILAIFPLLFLLLFLALYPEGTLALFTTTLGQFTLAVVVILVFVSVRWSNKLLSIDV